MPNQNHSIEQLEKKLLANEIRQNSEILSTLLADDFQEIGSSGQIFNKKQTIELLSQEPNFHGAISNFKSKGIATNTILATYEIQITLATTGQSYKSLRSSIWKKINTQWQIIFHQSTPL